ncbi:MAG: hypothetical protein ACOC2C_02165 [Cyclonatronaceae bacterium]
MKQILTLLFLFSAASLLLISCDSTSSNSEISTIELHMQAAVGNTGLKAADSKNQPGLEIQEVKFFIDEVELESVQNDWLDFEVEEFIVNLPLDGSPLIITEREVPPGLYDEFELEIERPDDSDPPVNDADFNDETGRYSVVVKGLFQDEPFMFRSDEEFEIEMDINPALEVTEAGSDILKITIDIDGWFAGNSSEVLDPTNPANKALINQNIARSFQAHDHDDDDDD